MHENHFTLPFFADYPAIRSIAVFPPQNRRVRASVVAVPQANNALRLADEIGGIGAKFLMGCQSPEKKRWKVEISLRGYLPIISNCIPKHQSCENNIKTCFLWI